MDIDIVGIEFSNPPGIVTVWYGGNAVYCFAGADTVGVVGVKHGIGFPLHYFKPFNDKLELLYHSGFYSTHGIKEKINQIIITKIIRGIVK